MNARFPNEDEQNPKTKSDESKMSTEDEGSRVDCRMVICIDLGTTFTSVSWTWSNGSRQNLSDERDVHTIPSFWGQEIKTTSVIPQGGKLTLVDTPGFDDTGLLDSEAVHTVAEHLQRLYTMQTKVNGIIYLYRIPDERTTRSNLENLRIFRRLCGLESPFNILATTSWNTTTWENRKRERNRSKRETVVPHLLRFLKAPGNEIPEETTDNRIEYVQISMIVTGVDEFTWVAYGFSDSNEDMSDDEHTVSSSSAAFHSGLQIIHREHDCRDEGKMRDVNQVALYGRHGDIKPENNLCFENSDSGENTTLKIADFGLGAFKQRRDNKVEVEEMAAEAIVLEGDFGASENLRNRLEQAQPTETGRLRGRPASLNHEPQKPRSETESSWMYGAFYCPDVMIKCPNSEQDSVKLCYDTGSTDNILSKEFVEKYGFIERPILPESLKVYNTFYSQKSSDDLLQLDTVEDTDRQLIYTDDIKDRWKNLMSNPTKGNSGLDLRNGGRHLEDRQPTFTHQLCKALRFLMSNPLTKGARATNNLSSLAPSLLFFANPVSASPKSAEDCTSNLHQQIGTLLHKFIHPSETMQPHELLFTLFLETLALVAIYTHNRDDAEQKYFLGAGMIISCIAGAVYSSTAQDFVLQYLFLGCLVALVGSAVSHAVQRKRERGITINEKELCFETAEIEEGVFKDEKM